MQLNFKLGNNIFLQGNKIISYETHVADIKEGCIEARGKYSRTTTKQISRVASTLGLALHSSDKRKDFWKHEFGARFSIDNCLSEKISTFIIGYMREKELDYLRCSHEDVLPMLITIPNVGPKDWEILKEYLNLPQNTPTPQQQEKDTAKALAILF
jgi:hypothetical protein